MGSRLNKDFSEHPLSHSSVTIKLADIQKRCSELLESNDKLLELKLEDYQAPRDNTNPYDHS